MLLQNFSCYPSAHKVEVHSTLKYIRGLIWIGFGETCELVGSNLIEKAVVNKGNLLRNLYGRQI